MQRYHSSAGHNVQRVHVVLQRRRLRSRRPRDAGWVREEKQRSLQCARPRSSAGNSRKNVQELLAVKRVDCRSLKFDGVFAQKNSVI